MLDLKAVQASAFIAGYAVCMVIVNGNKRSMCEEMAVPTSGIEEMESENDYLLNISRGGLLVPTTAIT